MDSLRKCLVYTISSLISEISWQTAITLAYFIILERLILNLENENEWFSKDHSLICTKWSHGKLFQNIIL